MGERPMVGHLRVFGCSAFSHIPKDERRKLDFESRRCILLGYSNNQKGYRLYDTERRNIIHNRDVQFNELEFRVEQEVPSESPAEPAVMIESSLQSLRNQMKMKNKI